MNLHRLADSELALNIDSGWLINGGFQEDYSVTGIVSCSEDEDEKICLRMSSLEVEAKKNTGLT